MSTFDFNNKTFSLVENSANGQVNSDTVFAYKQEGDLVTADYYGGTIRYGKILAVLKGDEMDMLYQCVTTANEMKAGRAKATVSRNENGKMRLRLNWEWFGDKEERGVSEYVEN